ncbi:hypothetical protein GCM10020331_013530 [Ectobacillus funiculus]
MPGKVVDGNDMIEIMNTVHEAVENARQGNGPALIEMKNIPLEGPFKKSDAKKYRTREEEAEWKQKKIVLKDLRKY